MTILLALGLTIYGFYLLLTGHIIAGLIGISVFVIGLAGYMMENHPDLVNNSVAIFSLAIFAVILIFGIGRPFMKGLVKAENKLDYSVGVIGSGALFIAAVAAMMFFGKYIMSIIVIGASIMGLIKKGFKSGNLIRQVILLSITAAYIWNASSVQEAGLRVILEIIMAVILSAVAIA